MKWSEVKWSELKWNALTLHGTQATPSCSDLPLHKFFFQFPNQWPHHLPSFHRRVPYEQVHLSANRHLRSPILNWKENAMRPPTTVNRSSVVAFLPPSYLGSFFCVLGVPAVCCTCSLRIFWLRNVVLDIFILHLVRSTVLSRPAVGASYAILTLHPDSVI